MIPLLLTALALAADPTCISLAMDTHSDGLQEWQLGFEHDGESVIAVVSTLQAAVVLAGTADPGTLIYDDYRDSDVDVTWAALECAEAGGPISGPALLALQDLWDACAGCEEVTPGG